MGLQLLGGIRKLRIFRETTTHQIRKLLLYPTELRGRDADRILFRCALRQQRYARCRWAEKDTISDSVPDRLGLNVFADCAAMDLSEKRLDHREPPQRRTVVALTGLMLIEQHPNRRHIEEA